DFIVPISADQHQVLHVRLRQQVLHEVQRRRIEPLQVVEKQGQGMFRPREYIDESTEYQVEPALFLLQRKLGNRWLLSDNGLQFRDQPDHQLSVRVERFMERVAPLAQLRLALAQKGADEVLKRLRQCGVRNIALVLVELARCKKSTRRHQRFVKLIDDGRFAYPGIAGTQHQFRPAALDDAVERGQQGLDLARSSVQLLGDQQPVWRVVFAERKRVDTPVPLPLGKTAPKITGDAGGSLVALLGGLREQLYHDGRERSGYSMHTIDWGHRLSGDMAVHPVHGIGRGERQ